MMDGMWYEFYVMGGSGEVLCDGGYLVSFM